MALLVVPTAVDQSYLGAIVAEGTPVVCLDRPAVGADIDAVVADDVGGVQRGMDLLIRRGHRRIAFLGTGSIYTTAQRRGYRQALATAGIDYDDALVHANSTKRRRSTRPSTPCSPSTIRRRRCSWPTSTRPSGSCPDCVRHWSPAIVAFSDFGARIHNPTVTVVDNDPVELGRRGAELALERLDGYRGPARRVCIDTRSSNVRVTSWGCHDDDGAAVPTRHRT